VTSIGDDIVQLAHMDESLAAMRKAVAAMQENLRTHDAVNVSLFGDHGARQSELLGRTGGYLNEADQLMFAAQAKITIAWVDLQRVIGDRA